MTIVELVTCGFSFDALLDMDVESFDALVERVLSIRANQKVESLHLQFCASQGGNKDVAKLANAIKPKASNQPKESQRDHRSRRA